MGFKKINISIILIVMILLFLANNQLTKANYNTTTPFITSFFEDFSNYSINNLQYSNYGDFNDSVSFNENADPAFYEGAGWNTPILESNNVSNSVKSTEKFIIYGRIKTNLQNVSSRGGFIVIADSNNNYNQFGIGIASDGRTYIRATYNNNTEGNFIKYTSWPINKWVWFKIDGYNYNSKTFFQVSYNLNEDIIKPEIWTYDSTFDHLVEWDTIEKIGLFVSHWKSNSILQKWEFDDLEIKIEPFLTSSTGLIGSTETMTITETTISTKMFTYTIDLSFVPILFSILIVAIKRRV
ncbi:MAG: hypothetical protein ACXAC7_16935 [Candidatus Hodarchaeales archaeon]|jgi:hypothetical protein